MISRYQTQNFSGTNFPYNEQFTSFRIRYRERVDCMRTGPSHDE